MAKTRLNAALRARLCDLVKELVVTPPETQAHIEDLQRAITDAWNARLYAALTPDEIKTLQRANVLQFVKKPFDTINGRRVRITPHDRVLDSWHTATHDLLERMRPSRAKKHDIALQKAQNAYEKAAESAAKALSARRAPYHALIKNSRTLEDVVAVWSEAAQVKPDNLPVAVVTTAQVAMIRDDMKARGAKP